MKLSIVIATIPQRLSVLPRIVGSLAGQMEGRDDCELIYLGDNQRISTGEKYNKLINMASGEYIVCAADDDLIAENFIEKLLDAIDDNRGVDVICFPIDVYVIQPYVGAVFIANIKTSIEHEWKDDRPNHILYRPPFEFAAIRADHRRACPYPDRWSGGDVVTMDSLKKHLKTEAQIECSHALYRWIKSHHDTPCTDMQKKHDRLAK